MYIYGNLVIFINFSVQFCTKCIALYQLGIPYCGVEKSEALNIHLARKARCNIQLLYSLCRTVSP